jgi:hypothetical protein
VPSSNAASAFADGLSCTRDYLSLYRRLHAKTFILLEFILLAVHSYAVAVMGGLTVIPNEGTSIELCRLCCHPELPFVETETPHVRIVAVALAIYFPMMLFLGALVIAMVTMGLFNLWNRKKHHFANSYHGIPPDSPDDSTPATSVAQRVLRMVVGPQRVPYEVTGAKTRVANFFWEHTCFRRHRRVFNLPWLLYTAS